jgi:hypothetical protein
MISCDMLQGAMVTHDAMRSGRRRAQDDGVADAFNEGTAKLNHFCPSTARDDS